MSQQFCSSVQRSGKLVRARQKLITSGRNYYPPFQRNDKRALKHARALSQPPFRKNQIACPTKRRIQTRTLFAKRLRNDFEASFRAPDSRGLIKSTRPPRATTTTTINTRIIENNAFKRSCRPEARVHAITRLPGAVPSRSFSLSVRETGGKGYFTVDSL